MWSTSSRGCCECQGLQRRCAACRCSAERGEDDRNLKKHQAQGAQGRLDAFSLPDHKLTCCHCRWPATLLHGTGQLPRIIAKLVQVFPYESSDKKQEVLKMVEVREILGIGNKVWRQEALWQVHALSGE